MDDGYKRGEAALSPGAAKDGNFPNYYRFNPAERRIEKLKLLTKDHFKVIIEQKDISCLDLGCNTGELTVELYSWMKCLLDDSSTVSMLGVDLDKELITCAQKKYINTLQVSFECCDVMSEDFWDGKEYDIISCFSVTLWIHLNNGDAGLCQFLTNISRSCRYLLMEVQPWKCYRTAVRRAKRSGNSVGFPLYNGLTIRTGITDYIDTYLITECAMDRVKTTGNTEWDREVILYKRRTSGE